MFVREWMTCNPLTVHPSTDLPQAVHLMRSRGIRHLPVVSHHKLCGIVTDRDLKAAGPGVLDRMDAWDTAYHMLRMTVHDVMQARVTTIQADAHIEAAAAVMAREKIGCLPVVSDDDVLVGIISQGDILRALGQIMGVAAGYLQVSMIDTAEHRARLSRFLSRPSLATVVFVENPQEIWLSFKMPGGSESVKHLLAQMQMAGLQVVEWRLTLEHDLVRGGPSLETLIGTVPGEETVPSGPRF